MVLCRYFMQGNCRFGRDCRFDHPNPNAYQQQQQQQNSRQGLIRPSQFQNPFGGGNDNSFGGGGGTHDNSFGGGGGTRSRLEGRLGPPPTNTMSTPGNAGRQTAGSSQQQPNQQGYSINEILNTVSQEMTTWKQSKMWPFSCFGYTKGVPSLPDLEDQSPEEIRFKAYTAKTSGSVSDYHQWISSLLQQYNIMKNQLEKPNDTIKNQLIQFINSMEAKDKSTTGTTNTFTPAALGKSQLLNQSTPFAAGSLFGKSSQPTQSVFGNQSQQPNTTSVFGGGTHQPSNTPAFPQQSVFTAANPTPGSVFGNASTTTSSGFGSMSSASTGSVFGNTQIGGDKSAFSTSQQNSVFGSVPSTNPTPFSAVSAPNPSPALFGKTSQQPQQQANQNMFGLQPQPTAPMANPSSAVASQPGAAMSTFSFAAPSNPAQATQPSNPVQATQPSNPVQATQPSAGQAVGLFGKPGTAPTQGSVFPGATTGGAAAAGHNQDWYTPLDKLTKEEMTEFQADKFTLSRLPIKPPPLELCR